MGTFVRQNSSSHTHTHTENSDLGDKIEEEEERLRELKTGVCGAELCLDS